jgi:trehalose-6-phosphatase
VGADFVLAIGDDWTDEDLFRALPPTAYSVRVGLANTAARYYLNNHTAVRRVLRELSQAPREKTADLPAGEAPSQAGSQPPKAQAA